LVKLFLKAYFLISLKMRRTITILRSKLHLRKYEPYMPRYYDEYKDLVPAAAHSKIAEYHHNINLYAKGPEKVVYGLPIVALGCGCLADFTTAGIGFMVLGVGSFIEMGGIYDIIEHKNLIKECEGYIEQQKIQHKICGNVSVDHPPVVRKDN